MSAPIKLNENRRSNIAMLFACLLVCWLISLIPSSWQAFARAALLESTIPVQSSRSWVVDFYQQLQTSDRNELAGLRAELHAQQQLYEQVLRQKDLQLVSALNAKSDRQDARLTPFQLTGGQSVIHSEVVRAEVVSIAQQKMLRKQMLVKVSSATELQSDQHVLQPVEETDSLVVDQGSSSGLSKPLPVFAGQCVIGQLSDIGNHVSRVRLVTDPDYRSRARILRKVQDGWSYGPEGVFEGMGQELCKLRYIGKTESVRVGDDVYTADPITSSSAPMYFGQIEKAELAPDAHEWTLWVRPAFDLDHLNTVQILRQSFLPNKTLAN